MCIVRPLEKDQRGVPHSGEALPLQPFGPSKLHSFGQEVVPNHFLTGRLLALCRHMPPKAPPRAEIKGKSKDGKPGTPPAKDKPKVTPRETGKPKVPVADKTKVSKSPRAAASPRGLSEEHQQQLAAAEARIAEAEARASEAEARAAATTEMHEADSEQAGALKSALARAEAAEKAAADAEQKAASLTAQLEEQKAAFAAAEKAAAAAQSRLQAELTSLKQQVAAAASTAQTPTQPTAPNASEAIGSNAASVEVAAADPSSPYKVLIELGDDAAADGLQVHVKLDGKQHVAVAVES